MSEKIEDENYQLNTLTEYDRQLLAYCGEVSAELCRRMKSRGFMLIAFILSMAALEAKIYGKR